MNSLLQDNCWENQAVYLVGGGSSLKSFDWDLLKGVPHVIAINAAFLYVPWADVVLSEDERFFRRFAVELQHFEGIKVFAAPDDSYVAGVLEVVPDAVAMRSCPKREGWPKTFAQGLSTSSNSMIPALSLADLLGAERLYLLGVDCTPGTFHGLYPKDWEAGEAQLASFRSDFEHWAAPHLAHRRVVNLTPLGTPLESAVGCWPKWDRDSFLRTGHPSIEDALEPGFRPEAMRGLYENR